MTGDQPQIVGPAPPRYAPDLAWWQTPPPPPDPPPYLRTSRYVPVRDGTRLAVDVFLPTALEGTSLQPRPRWEVQRTAVHPSRIELPLRER